MRLREARAGKLMSVRDLAQAAGVAPRTILDAEAGRQIPYFGTVRKLAAALGMEPSEIDEFAARIELATRGKGAA